MQKENHFITKLIYPLIVALIVAWVTYTFFVPEMSDKAEQLVSNEKTINNPDQPHDTIKLTNSGEQPSKDQSIEDDTDDNQVSKEESVFASKDLIGTWEGNMIISNSKLNPTQIIIQQNAYGQLSGRITHPMMNCGADLELIRSDGLEFTFFQKRKIGGSRCVSGQTKLILEDKNTIIRIWYNPQTGKEATRGTLKRV